MIFNPFRYRLADKNSHLSNWSVPWPANLTTTSQDTLVDKVLHIKVTVI